MRRSLQAARAIPRSAARVLFIVAGAPVTLARIAATLAAVSVPQSKARQSAASSPVTIRAILRSSLSMPARLTRVRRDAR